MNKYIDRLHKMVQDKAIIGFPFIRSFISQTDLSNAYIPFNVFLHEFVKKYPEFVYTYRPRKISYSVKLGNLVVPTIIAIPKRSLINVAIIKDRPYLEREELIDVEILPFFNEKMLKGLG